MYALMVKELNKPPVIELLEDAYVNTCFNLLEYYERDIINPNYMFWVIDKNSPDILITPPCLN